ncbi:protein Mpv17-like [Diorhabda carinulata]|uniref:protein Mpv17-like n=1 Tax=Diorhabda carinulata TaxID=1163345 RepID=UPI0025A09E77|nr:protein Mpv17-like [Diorhabda carinulata]
MILKKFMNLYSRLLKNNLILVQSIQSGVFCGTGDVIAQVIAEKKSFSEIDVRRTGCFILLGSGYVGPILSIWYKFLSRKLGDKGKFVVLKKVAADQLLFAPPFQIGLITVINSLQGRDFDFIKNQIRQKYTDILLTGYKLWPAVQIINFYFVPLSYQVLVVQSVALFWNAYISWKTQYGVAKMHDSLKFEEKTETQQDTDNAMTNI